ncbi:conjugal transfer protein MobC [Mucilaginibacter paludis]|uniref:TRAG family protein n=1 Tax=Mucilaginibacter paludis DSM 18603 TaxID=714943 RepID=H1YBX4_9SPHI|nr:conjugal transfer protein MobC [Mucilaginibacter paludis]EHQ27052.1 TRAG family protein [Mucilaginibacter paludis DSM 18603]
MANTGENEQALRKILDMTRLISIALLTLHFYYYCYGAFQAWGLTMPLTNNLLKNISSTGLFNTFHRSKLIALALLIVALIGAKGKKDDKQNYKTALAYILTGLLIYFITYLCFSISLSVTQVAIIYMSLTSLGFLLILTGGTLVSRIIKSNFNNKDIFNLENETFPQEERLLINENSVNLPMRYQLRNKWRKGFLNIVAPYRSTLVSGSAGSGKTSSILRFFISQALAKDDPYTMLIYDFKFPDLSVIAYNHYLKNKHKYKNEAECFFINFEDPSRSHRGNPLEPESMSDITDATESARTILLGLNKVWQTRQGDFFVESPINFFTAIIWFLRQYQNGRFCTLPHAIELIQLDYDTLFTILRTKELEALINPFVRAYENDVMEQLEGQIASAKIALARLSSPQLYYVLTGNDFSLDINNPEKPKILCIGNNPQKIQIYGAVLSLFANRLLKVINQKNKLKSMLLLDEYPTISVDLIPTISTGRSNRIAVVMGVQSVNQLRKEYGREQADVIMSIAGNLIAGQETGDSAKQLSEQIGKIMQDRESLSISDSGTSVSKSRQLESAVPPSKIAKLSAGQFAGILSDLPDQKIELKAFDCEMLTDFDAINKEEAAYKPIPIIRQVDQGMINRNYLQVKKDIEELAQAEMERMMNDPAMAHLVIKKNS